MPNKHKFSKLKTKLLASGKLNTNKNVKDTLKNLEQKARLDNEDVNYNFEKDAGKNFDKLEDGERMNRKIKKLNAAKPFGFENKKKRKNENQNDSESKPVKKAKMEPENNKSKEALVAKKSKKNKYFYMAHPELIQDKQEISKEKFVIDEEKLKLNELKKKKKKTPEVSQKNSKKEKNSTEKVNKKPKLKTKNNNVWLIDACTSSDDDDNEKKEKSEEGSHQVLDLDDIEKNFEIKEVEEKLEDGTVIKVFKPVIVESHEEQTGEDSGVDQENEEEEEEKAPEEPNKASQGNKLMDKLKSSRFRYLNEVFYTQSSDKSCEYFQK